MRRIVVAALGLVVCATIVAAETEPLPIIVTYELRKARRAERAEARDPRQFWIRQIMARIEDKVAATPLKLTGPVTVELGFAVTRDGHLAAPAVTKSSGVPEADAAAKRILESAQPFPPMPDNMDLPQLGFSLPMRFK